MAAEFKKKYDLLDVLINNAAVFKSGRTVTADGYETMFATNHLGPFLLTNLLLSRLKAAPAARILTLTPPSTTKIPFEDLQAEHKFRALQAFRVSKAANLLFTFDLAHRLASTTVTVNAISAGSPPCSPIPLSQSPNEWSTTLLLKTSRG